MRPGEAETTNIVQIERINNLWAYVLPDDKLVTGSGYGNKKCFANSKATGAIESLFSLDLGRNVIGSTLVRYYDAESGVLLEQTGTGDFTIHPAYQKRRFKLAHDLRISEIFYVPNAPQDDLDECAAAYLGLKIVNKTADVQRISVVGFSDLRPRFLATTPDVEVRYSYENAAIIASNRSNERWTRFFGTTAPNPTCSYTTDISAVTDNFNITPSLRPSCEQYVGGTFSAERCSVQYVPLTSDDRRSPNDGSDDRAIIGRIQVDLELQPEEEREFTFLIGFSADGDADATRQFERLKDYASAFEHTLRHFVSETSHSVVTTPDQVINRGVQWAKANMARVKALYPQGRGFTNDPGMSSNIVARDTSWFAFGCDYVAPEFSKQALKVFKRLQSTSGLIPEYYNGVTGEVDDYQLNINDGTPLYVLAVEHTFQITDDRAFLEEMYPSVEKAAEYIISQKDDRGLVYCTADGVGVYGICGWRNIIPNYGINGAVTEVNAECFAALRATALLADLMGYDERAAFFRGEAKKLKNAINRHLIDLKSGLYYLNIDTARNEHPDVTCDLIFPVIFNVATPATSHLIIDRLNRPDFLTTAGLRTVPRTALNYHPERGWGLTGGVWPDVAFMFAYSCSMHQPDVMVNIMRGTFRQYELDPTNQNTVPGQFSEWYHGESLVNNGMKLSPWFPPKYLWTAVEGVCGVGLYRGLHINPNIPLRWKWVSLANMPFHDGAVTYFACWVKGRLTIFANYPFGTSLKNARTELDDDVTHMIHERLEEIHLVALATPSHVVICVGNMAASSTSFTFGVSEIIETYVTPGRYRIRVFHSEIDDWYDQGVRESGNVRGFTVGLEVGGFKLIELTAQVT
ncbi:MAG TPA: amylo-alpha-1,6-glucosidase [Candidatus Bathyarchaeia archaeon]|nr:amylo-alpha-1,6-glucosidase [Candidatus Bathyarchaeia archaeon]